MCAKSRTHPRGHKQMGPPGCRLLEVTLNHPPLRGPTSGCVLIHTVIFGWATTRRLQGLKVQTGSCWPPRRSRSLPPARSRRFWPTRATRRGHPDSGSSDGRRRCVPHPDQPRRRQRRHAHDQAVDIIKAGAGSHDDLNIKVAFLALESECPALAARYADRDTDFRRKNFCTQAARMSCMPSARGQGKGGLSRLRHVNPLIRK